MREVEFGVVNAEGGCVFCHGYGGGVEVERVVLLACWRKNRLGIVLEMVEEVRKSREA